MDHMNDKMNQKAPKAEQVNQREHEVPENFVFEKSIRLEQSQEQEVKAGIDIFAVLLDQEQRMKKLEAAAAQANRRSSLFLAYIIQETGIEMPTKETLVSINDDDAETIEMLPISPEDDSDVYFDLVDGEEPTPENLLVLLATAALSLIQNGDAEEVLRVMNNPHLSKILTPSMRAEVKTLLKDGVN